MPSFVGQATGTASRCPGTIADVGRPFVRWIWSITSLGSAAGRAARAMLHKVSPGFTT